MVKGNLEEAMTMERLLQLAYLAGRRDGLERAEQLLLRNTGGLELDRETENAGAKHSRVSGHSKRSGPLFRLARTGHQD